MRPRYHDPFEDPLFDREDLNYGDYDDNDLDGFSVFRFDDPEEEEDD